MTTRNGKAAPEANRAASKQDDHTTDDTATAQKIGNSPYGSDFVQVAAEKVVRRSSSGAPAVVVLQLAHDDWCKTLKTGRSADCNCNPDESFWVDTGKGGTA
jgi:hypothetical protein